MSLMMAQMGLDLAGNLADFASSRIQSRMERDLQAYRNNIMALQTARSRNAITVNEIRAQDADAEQDFLIQRTSMADKARAEVNAAAAGVAGNSIKMMADDLAASAGRAQYARQRQLNQSLAEMGDQRTSVAIGQVLNKDIQVIPKPSIGSLLLGGAASMLDIYDSHQPTSNKLLR